MRWNLFWTVLTVCLEGRTRTASGSSVWEGDKCRANESIEESSPAAAATTENHLQEISENTPPINLKPFLRHVPYAHQPNRSANRLYWHHFLTRDESYIFNVNQGFCPDQTQKRDMQRETSIFSTTSQLKGPLPQRSHSIEFCNSWIIIIKIGWEKWLSIPVTHRGREKELYLP